MPAWYRQDLLGQGGAWSTVDDAPYGWAHGRRERRLLWLLADPALNAYAGSTGEVGQAWPHLRQVFRLERHRTIRRAGIPETSVQVVYGITSLPPTRANAAAVLAYQRGEWGIENRVHWIRDVTLDEDRCQVRSDAAPQVLAACRNLVISLIHRTGSRNVAAAQRTYAGRPRAAVALICPALAARRG